MPKPVLLRILLLVLQRRGFIRVSQKGSHAKFVLGDQTVIVPMHGKEVPHGTMRSILRQSGLTHKDFK